MSVNHTDQPNILQISYDKTMILATLDRQLTMDTTDECVYSFNVSLSE